MRVLTLSGSDLLFQQRRARINEEAPPEDRENLLAVTQVLAGLRYMRPDCSSSWEAEMP